MNLFPSRSIISTVPVACSVRIWLFRTIVVDSCGAVAWRAFLLNTPSVLVTPTSAPPVTLLCWVYLKSARLVPAVRMVTVIAANTVLSRMSCPQASVEFSDIHVLPRWFRNGSTSSGHRRLEATRIHLLRRPHRGAIFHAAIGHASQNVFERAQNPNRVEIIVVPYMRDPEQLALHLPLPVRDYSVKRFTELFYDLARVDSVRRADRSQGSRRRRRIEFQAQSLCARPRHLRTNLGIVDQFFPAFDQIAAPQAPHKRERRSQRRKQRSRRRIS